MPEVRALRSFKGRYGSIRAGQTFNCEPGYLSQLLKNKLVTPAGEPGPSNDRNIPEAPHRGGKDQGGKDAPPKNPGSPSGPATGSGKALTSASLPAGQASRKKTVLTSAAGKKGKSKPKRAKGKTKTSSTPATVPPAE